MSVDIADWLRAGDGPALIASDAPLGWPLALGGSLSTHVAGRDIPIAADDPFRRATDRFIKRTLGKTPLDVGADRIARTAHTALRLLANIGRLLGSRVPLAWTHSAPNARSALDVYPAAWLVAHGIRSMGYKKPTQREERREIIGELRKRAAIGRGLAEMEDSADALDAVVCLLAATDFLAGHAAPPEDLELALREGWIWARTRLSGERS